MKKINFGVALAFVAGLFASSSGFSADAQKSFGQAYELQVYDGETLKWSGQLPSDKEFINEKFEDDPKVTECAETDVECNWRANGSPFFYLERRAGLMPEFGLGRMYGFSTLQTADGQQKLSIPDIRERGWHLPLDEQASKEFHLRGAEVGAANVTYRVVLTKIAD